MRLTGGSDRGRKLRAPRGQATRPTASRVREAIFNILGPPDDAQVLDLFAGTGALGIEALSRGAAAACFVERDGRALQSLYRNLRELGLSGRSQVMGMDVHSAIGRLDEVDRRFGWVFVDPPYAAGEVGRVLEGLSGSRILAACAVVVVEHDKRNVPPDQAGMLNLCDRRFYGDTGVSFYRRSANLA
jgi:16S rRNA (guanine(966)-N(2))-methyltransferase RsmD